MVILACIGLLFTILLSIWLHGSIMFTWYSCIYIRFICSWNLYRSGQTYKYMLGYPFKIVISYCCEDLYEMDISFNTLLYRVLVVYSTSKNIGPPSTTTKCSKRIKMTWDMRICAIMIQFMQYKI